MPSGSLRSYAGPGLVAAIVGALLAAAAASPQDPAQQRPTFRVGSSFVRVDAYPSKDGKAVPDLEAEEFEVLEDGVPQKIESFEHVVIRAGAPDTEKTETSSQRESLQAAANPRNRVFVIFIDAPHITLDVVRLNEALIRMLDRVLGPDDLVGVMSPKMSASQVVLGRKTRIIEESLRSNSAFIEQLVYGKDRTEEGYEECGDPTKLVPRKRERATLEALQDLVRYLRTIREERKAIFTVTGGWQLYREDRSLLDTKPRPDQIVGLDKPRVGPDGTLTNRPDPRADPRGLPTRSACDADRIRLATMDNDQFFRDLLAEANAANASFYPVDPGGLAVFNAALLPSPEEKTLQGTMALRQKRTDTLKTLAESTDGVAMVDTNDFDSGLRRISDDLTSYYLLGYSSTNTKMDGRFRQVKVRVTRPGVIVRARRGYRGPTAEEMTTARSAAESVPEGARTVMSAIGRLGSPRGDLPFRINAVTASTAAGSPPALWVAGELVPQPGRPDEFAKGGTAVVDATIGTVSVSSEVTLKPGERTFVTQVPVAASATGEISVKARITPHGGGLPFTDILRVPGTPTPDAAQPLFFRRGVTTGNRWVPAADLRFSRTERIRLEWPVAAGVSVKAVRVLDRAGQPLQIPAVIGSQVPGGDASATFRAQQTWATVELTLAPLSTADYAIEVEMVGGQTTQKIVTGLRVIR